MTKNMKNKIICITAALIVFGGFLLCLFMPKETYSYSERRELKDFPEASLSSVLKGDFMKNFEEYASDSFPFRDTFRSTKAYFAYYLLGQKDNNKIYIHNGYIGSMDYPYNEKSVEYATGRFRYVYEKYLTGSKIYLSVIPDKNVFLANEAGVLSYDSSKLIRETQKSMPYAEYIDIFPTLSIEDYYRTDSHWRQEKIEDTATTLADGLGVTLSEEREQIDTDSDFYGVYYGQAALKMPADSISYLTSPLISQMTAFDGQNSKSIPVYDTKKLTGKDPYEMYLSGPLSLVTINNPKAENEKELIIFRDSFASAIAPLLAEGYSKVTLIDIRYINIDYLGSMVDFGKSDVLFLYSTSVLNNSETIK